MNIDINIYISIDNKMSHDIIARMTKNKLVKTHNNFNFKQAYNKLRSNKLNCAQTQTQTFKEAYDKLRSNKLNKSKLKK